MASTSRLISPLILVLTALVATDVSAIVTDGVASYYGDRFHGRKTASGQRFNMHDLTAAHRSLQFGTRVLVTNKDNGRSVEVTINDRGPYVRGRSIDLSKGAARELGMIGRGTARVALAVVDQPSSSARSRSSRGERIVVAQAERILMELF